MNLSDEQLDKIAKFVVINLAGIIATLIIVITAVALFGSHIAPLMNKLPW
ncbi:MAG: hypothetical protein ACR2NW_10430 [Thermodesulfobacteriota bacterium]